MHFKQKNIHFNENLIRYLWSCELEMKQKEKIYVNIVTKRIVNTIEIRYAIGKNISYNGFCGILSKRGC